jgi:hypothetical protein
LSKLFDGVEGGALQVELRRVRILFELLGLLLRVGFARGAAIFADMSTMIENLVFCPIGECDGTQGERGVEGWVGWEGNDFGSGRSVEGFAVFVYVAV